MSKLPRKYSKSDGRRAELALGMVEKSTSPNSQMPEIHLNASFQKEEGTLSPKTFWIIVSGGEAREKDYFKIVSQQAYFNRIKLKFIADPNKLSPKGMFETACYWDARYRSSRHEESEPDRFYLVSDVDHFMAELKEIKPLCEQAGFKLTISNSCFEVWLYYAFCNRVPDFPIPENPLKISKNFKTWANTSIVGGLKSTQAIFRIRENIENAKKNYEEDETGIPKLFSTNMFLLAEELLPLINMELDKLIEANKLKEEQFRRRTNK